MSQSLPQPCCFVQHFSKLQDTQPPPLEPNPNPRTHQQHPSNSDTSTSQSPRSEISMERATESKQNENLNYDHSPQHLNSARDKSNAPSPGMICMVFKYQLFHIYIALF